MDSFKNKDKDLSKKIPPGGAAEFQRKWAEEDHRINKKRDQEAARKGAGLRGLDVDEMEVDVE